MSEVPIEISRAQRSQSETGRAVSAPPKKKYGGKKQQRPTNRLSGGRGSRAGRELFSKQGKQYGKGGGWAHYDFNYANKKKREMNKIKSSYTAGVR